MHLQNHVDKNVVENAKVERLLSEKFLNWSQYLKVPYIPELDRKKNAVN